ncbi:MAG: TolB family protein [Acidimicrobiia bacterium]
MSVLSKGIVTTVVVAWAVFLPGCGDDGTTAAPETTTTTEAEPVTTVTDSTSSTPEESGPVSIVAVQQDRIVELSGGDGSVLRTLVELPGEKGTTTWVEADRDHDRIFFGQAQDCGDRIFMTPVTGGRPVAVAPGGHVTVSPDGSRIAFSRVEDGCAPAALVVRDLATGAERIWRTGGEVISVEWAPDGRRLAYTVFDGEADTMHLLDTGVAGDRLDAPVLHRGRLHDAALTEQGWVLAVIERCDIGADPDCAPALRTVNGDTGEVLEDFPPVPRLSAVDLDAGGVAPLLLFTEVLGPQSEQTVLGRFQAERPRRLAVAIAGDW